METPDRTTARTGLRIEDMETVIAYLQYAMQEVREISGVAAYLLDLAIHALCEEVDARKTSAGTDNAKRLS